jgi:hypothetical protein
MPCLARGVSRDHTEPCRRMPDSQSHRACLGRHEIGLPPLCLGKLLVTFTDTLQANRKEDAKRSHDQTLSARSLAETQMTHIFQSVAVFRWLVFMSKSE